MAPFAHRCLISVPRLGRLGAALGLALLVQACGPSAPPGPLTMPLADGREQTVRVSPFTYVVNRRERGESRPGVMLRVTRVNARDLDYSDGLRAKKAVEAYCATFNRQLDPRAVGRFSTPNAWVFDGDCQ
ncbi:hypothetical protein GC209_11770 [bacterium]|nr:hypothetical protein [bacterium]